MANGVRRTYFLAALYILAVHYAYVEYINPVFEYLRYDYLQFSLSELLITYFLSWIVIVFYKNTAHPAQAIVGLLYILVYIPAQLIILFTVDKTYYEIVLPQIALAASMAFLFVAARTYKEPSRSRVVFRRFFTLDATMVIFMVLAICLVVFNDFDHMRFVTFEQVYDLRAESVSANKSKLAEYSQAFLAYFFTTYFYARGLVYKKWIYIGVGLIGSMAIYMAEAAKAIILLLPITYALIVIWKDGRGFLWRVILSALLGVVVLVLVVPDEGVYRWVKSIILLRVIGSDGWVLAKYMEYFDKNGFTYYSHIGPIQAIFGGYLYGDYSLGQLIGMVYNGSPEYNHNASFWASDGFAAFGVLGIFIITPFVGVFFNLFNRLTYIFPTSFVIAWAAGFIIAFLNTPFTTALFSFGGLGILFVGWWATKKVKNIEKCGKISSNSLVIQQ